jgi:hypothetical protein
MESMLRCGPLLLSRERTHSQALMFLRKAEFLVKSKTGFGSGSAYRKSDPDPDPHQHDADPHHRISRHQNFQYKLHINSTVFFSELWIRI